MQHASAAAAAACNWCSRRNNLNSIKTFNEWQKTNKPKGKSEINKSEKTIETLKQQQR